MHVYISVIAYEPNTEIYFHFKYKGYSGSNLWNVLIPVCERWSYSNQAISCVH